MARSSAFMGPQSILLDLGVRSVKWECWIKCLCHNLSEQFYYDIVLSIKATNIGKNKICQMKIRGTLMICAAALGP